MKDIDVTDTKQQISSLNSENSLSYGHFKEVIFISMKNRILILTNRNWKGGKGTAGGCKNVCHHQESAAIWIRQRHAQCKRLQPLERKP